MSLFRTFVAASPHLILFLMVIVNFTSITAVYSGSSAALNASVDYNPATFEKVSSNVKKNVSENISGATEAYVMSQVKMFTAIVDTIAKPSYRFGYHHPTVGRVYAPFAKWITFLGMGLYGYGEYRKRRKRL